MKLYLYDDDGLEVPVCEICGCPGDTVTMNDGMIICSSCLDAGKELFDNEDEGTEAEELNDIEWEE